MPLLAMSENSMLRLLNYCTVPETLTVHFRVLSGWFHKSSARGEMHCLARFILDVNIINQRVPIIITILYERDRPRGNAIFIKTNGVAPFQICKSRYTVT